MDALPASQGPSSATTAARWQRWADRLARSAWLILVAAVTVALIGGVISAITWQPSATPALVVECPDPPCLGGGGLPGVRDLPFILPLLLPLLGYLLAIVLGLPSLLAGADDLLRGRWAVGSRRLLPFVGPLLVFIGVEVVPHLINPGGLSWLLDQRWFPGLCAYNPDWGGDVTDRWHALDHALVGALPLTALYSLALRRWHPTVAR